LHSTTEGFSPRSHLHPQLTDSHSPHACPTPGVYTFTVQQSIGCYTSLSLGFNNRPDQEFSELCGCYWTPSRRTHFLNTLSHLERVAHRPDNLLLLSTGLTTRFFTPTPPHTSMVMETTKLDLGMVHDGINTGNPKGIGVARVSIQVCCRGSCGSRIQQGIPGYSCLLGALVKKWPREEPPKQYEFSLILHVPELTHGAHEARSSPFGSHTLFPKELRIYSYPTHNI
jgi:hypothetical protein